MAAEQEAIIQVLISLAILLFAAKIFAEMLNKLKRFMFHKEITSNIVEKLELLGQ